jgi:hypothetical protein
LCVKVSAPSSLFVSVTGKFHTFLTLCILIT